METADYIRHWVTGAERDWRAAEVLLQADSFPQGLFFAHLTIEKLAKAHWIREHQNPDPPFWHDIVRILHATRVVLPPELLDTASDLTALQAESRYPDYSTNFYDQLTAPEAQSLWKRTALLREYLRERLP